MPNASVPERQGPSAIACRIFGRNGDDRRSDPRGRISVRARAGLQARDRVLRMRARTLLAHCAQVRFGADWRPAYDEVAILQASAGVPGQSPARATRARAWADIMASWRACLVSSWLLKLTAASHSPRSRSLANAMRGRPAAPTSRARRPGERAGGSPASFDGGRERPLILLLPKRLGGGPSVGRSSSAWNRTAGAMRSS